MSPFAAAFNHVLTQNAWAQEKLALFAGKLFQLRLPPAVLNFSLDATGSVRQATGGTPDATLVATPTGFLRYLAVDPRDPNLIAIEGDVEFGAALREILSQLTWEAEEDLSRLFGDVLAHRIAGFAKNWFTWREQSFKNLALGASEYFTEEQPLLAKPNQLAQFKREVEALTSEVAQLEERIEKLG
ncbi:MAG: hypothetical protein Q8L39_05345 [Burkholderiales bacterium]|nr:hypothetical protein [Burkholderiales bacterium]